MRTLILMLLLQFFAFNGLSQRIQGFNSKRQIVRKQRIMVSVSNYILEFRPLYLEYDSVRDKKLRKQLSALNADIVSIEYKGFPHEVDSIVVFTRFHGKSRHNGRDTSWFEDIIYDLTKRANYFSIEELEKNGYRRLSDRIYYFRSTKYKDLK
jgi:hypothetical protein